MITYSLTNQGRVRSNNQDFYFSSDTPVGVLPNLYIVADGMGGHNAGEFASHFGVESLLESVKVATSIDTEEVLLDATERANGMLYAESVKDIAKAGCGTTMVEAVIENNKLVVLNIGDSRLYYITKDGITQITRDHSVVEELVRSGILTSDEARVHPDRHKITRAFGIEPQVEADVFERDVAPGGYIIMCTDGLSNMVTDEELFGIVMDKRDPKLIAEAAVSAANEAGGTDNITITVIAI